MNAPSFGDRTITELYQKHSYPFGIMVNLDGNRFLDEGADFRNYTYVTYGRALLTQPRDWPSRYSTTRLNTCSGTSTAFPKSPGRG